MSAFGAKYPGEREIR